MSSSAQTQQLKQQIYYVYHISHITTIKFFFPDVQKLRFIQLLKSITQKIRFVAVTIGTLPYTHTYNHIIPHMYNDDTKVTNFVIIGSHSQNTSSFIPNLPTYMYNISCANTKVTNDKVISSFTHYDLFGILPRFTPSCRSAAAAADHQPHQIHPIPTAHQNTFFFHKIMRNSF